MTVSYKDALEQARVFLREEKNRLTPTDWLLVAEQSRQHFSRDKPIQLIDDIAGDGTATYTLTATVTDWVNSVSTIESVEFPAGSQKPVYLPRNEFILYRPDNTNEELRFLYVTPTASETIRLKYTAPHSFDESDSTIADMDKMLIALLLAAYAAQALSADFLKPNRSNIPNDSTDFSQKSADLGALAAKLLKQYATMLRSMTDGAKSHYTFVKDFDMLTGFGDDYLVHSSKDR